MPRDAAAKLTGGLEPRHLPGGSREAFAATLRAMAADARDRWVDDLFGMHDLPEDAPLPRGCVPYLPCAVEPLLRVIELAEVGPDDVFVDVGSGLGRAALLVHALTGARAIGLEIQPALVHASRRLARQLRAEHVRTIEGDAAQTIHAALHGTVFFLYCPFGGARLELVLDAIAGIAHTRDARVCSVDLPLPARPGLAPLRAIDDLAVYRTCRTA